MFWSKAPRGRRGLLSTQKRENMHNGDWQLLLTSDDGRAVLKVRGFCNQKLST